MNKIRDLLAAKRKPYPMKDHVGVLVHEVARLRKHVFDKILSFLDITRSQRWVLVYLSQLEGRGISQRDLAKMMNITPVSLGEKLQPLESRKWIERRTAPGDLRQRLIFMTELGYDVLAQSRKISLKTNRAITKDIPPEDIAIAERTLRAMRRNLAAMNGSD